MGETLHNRLSDIKAKVQLTHLGPQQSQTITHSPNRNLGADTTINSGGDINSAKETSS